MNIAQALSFEKVFKLPIFVDWKNTSGSISFSDETLIICILSTGQHLLIFIMFLCLFFIAVLMGLAGPSMTMKFTVQASTLKGKEAYKSWFCTYTTLLGSGSEWPKDKALLLTMVSCCKK